MSGLAAIYDASGRPPTVGEIDALLAPIRHRGRHESIYSDAGIALGERLLMPTSEPVGPRQYSRGVCPCLIVLDGRLDNRDELFASLSERASENTASDSELVLLAYEKWGPDCVREFVGDFAFIIWDPRTRTLLAARDQRGVRPLVYARYGSRFVFGSEPQQLWADESVPRTIDQVYLACHLSGVAPPKGATQYASICEVPPAHYCLLENGRLTLHEYWQYGTRPSFGYKNRRDYVEHFEELFKDVIAAHTRSAGPVGVLLSGGLDSSLVTLKATERNPDLKTLSLYAAGTERMDERSFSRAVSQSLGIENTEIDASDWWTLRSDLLSDEHFDQPSQPVQSAAVMGAYRAAEQMGIKVLLDGAGGDELFTGSWDYVARLTASGSLSRAFREARSWSRGYGVKPSKILQHAVLTPLVPPSMRRSWRASRGNRVPDRLPPWLDGTRMEACGLATALDFPDEPAIWGGNKRASLFWSSYLAEVLPATSWWERHAGLPHGIESRSPLWDLRVIEFCLRTPEWVHRKGGRTKVLLREIMRERLPDEVVQREGKGLYNELMVRGIVEEEQARVRSSLIEGPLSKLLYVMAPLLERELDTYVQRRHAWWAPLWRSITAGLWLQSNCVSRGQSTGRSLLAV